MQNRNGFFLIELLIYLSIFSFLIVLLMRSFIFSAQHLATDNKYAYVIAQLYATEQLMLRELEKVPTEPRSWCFVKDNEIIWHAVNKEIGWCFQDDKLVRNEGNYNSEKHSWHNKKTSIGAKNIKEGKFIFTWSNNQQEPQLLFISVKITTNNLLQDHVFCVCPRNRVLL